MFHVNPLPRIHMKHQALLFLKNNEKYSKLTSAAVLIGALTQWAYGAKMTSSRRIAVKVNTTSFLRHVPAAKG